MPETANATLRLPKDLLDRIDEAARLANVSRTEYMVSWLPVRYDGDAINQRRHGNAGRRVVRSQQQSSPARDSSSV